MMIYRAGLLVTLAVLALAATQTNADAVWKSCAGPIDFLNELKVSFPAEPAKGRPFSIHLEGKLAKDVGDGQVHLDVFLYGAKIFTKDQPMCSGGKSSCPYRKGKMVYDEHVDMPSYVPSGPYEVKLTFYDMKDPDHAEIACVDVSYTISEEFPSNEAVAHPAFVF